MSGRQDTAEPVESKEMLCRQWDSRDVTKEVPSYAPLREEDIQDCRVVADLGDKRWKEPGSVKGDERTTSVADRLSWSWQCRR